MSASSDLRGAETPETPTSTSSNPLLALPAPEASASRGSKVLEMDQTISLDDLGPMVVNSDGVRFSPTNANCVFDAKNATHFRHFLELLTGKV